MDNNYIGKVDAEWVDPKVELPPEMVDIVAIIGNPEYLHVMTFDGESWMGRSGLTLPVPVAWLRIGGPSTAIPREKVQAAVDHMCTFNCRNIGVQNGAWSGRIVMDASLDTIRNHTGITPSGVKDSLTTEVTP